MNCLDLPSIIKSQMSNQEAHVREDHTIRTYRQSSVHHQHNVLMYLLYSMLSNKDKHAIFLPSNTKAHLAIQRTFRNVYNYVPKMAQSLSEAVMRVSKMHEKSLNFFSRNSLQNKTTEYTAHYCFRHRVPYHFLLLSKQSPPSSNQLC